MTYNVFGGTLNVAQLSITHECAYDCAQLQYITQHRTVLIIFYHIIQTIITAWMLHGQ